MLDYKSCNLHWIEVAGLTNLAFMLVLIPIDSGASLAFFCVWVISTIIKNFLLKRWSFFWWHQDKSYIPAKKFCLMLPMLCYWIIYLISMFWTENKTTGWVNVGQLIWFALFLIAYSITDFREINSTHIKSIFWIFIFCMCVLFFVVLIGLIINTSDVENHHFLDYLSDNEFYELHHSYMAVYLLSGIAFLYSEVDRLKWNVQNKKRLLFIGGCGGILLLFLVLDNSRAGILGLFILLVLFWLHQAFVRKHKRLAIITLVLFPIIVVIVHLSLPEQFHRLSNTIEKTSQGEEDMRVVIARNTWNVIQDNIILGVGAGDSMDELAPYYINDNEDYGHVYNAHNQYLETWLATGLLGLVSILAMMLLPLSYAIMHKNFFMFNVIFIFAISILFESMFERQMGVVFFCVVMFLLAINVENTNNVKFCNNNIAPCYFFF